MNLSIVRITYIKSVLFFLLVANIGFPQQIRFKHLTVEDGLSNNIVNTVIQDQTGFIWFATEDGLNRFDGYNFKIFRNDPDDSNSLSDNSIWSLMEDHAGNIWIGTKSGILNKYDPTTEKFTHWEIHSEFTEENSIKALYEDSNGNIWIGSYRDGLYRLNPSTNKMDHWSRDTNDVKSLSHNYVLAIIEDKNGNILVGTYNGLNKYNPNQPQNGFKHFYYDPDNQNSLSNNLIWGLSKSSIDPNNIWIGTHHYLTKFNSEKLIFNRIEIPNPNNLQYGESSGWVIEDVIANENIIWTDSYSGIVRMNLTTGESTRFIHDENNSYSLINDQVNRIIKDRSGVIWIVTENGVSYITPKSNLFNSIDIGDTNILSVLEKRNITTIYKSRDNNVWIGTVNGLYALMNINKNLKLRRVNKFDGYNIWSLTSINENQLWVGTYGKGLKEYNYQIKKTSDRNINYPGSKTQSLYYIKSLLTDSKNNIWVGYWGIGAARINSKTENSNLWLNEPGNNQSLSNNDVWVIKEDRFGRIWLGTVGGGINLFEDKDAGIFHRWTRNVNKVNNLNSNNIYSICEAKNLESQVDSVTILWIGTSDGLNRFEVINNKGKNDLYDVRVKIQSYTIKDGLSDNSVNSIIEDEKGNLWLGTGSGISFFNVSEKTFINFSTADGINGTLMNAESALRLDDGLILFGSTKGMNIFDPKKIMLSSYKPNVVISDFKIFNKPVVVGENSPLKESILKAKEITLSNNQDVLSFEFAALDYNSPQSILYAYKMEGFDTDWIQSGTRRFVTYTNLDPGNYTFKVKATNADGIWNNEFTSLKIIVNPPWWQTRWAYISYVILIGLGLFAIRRFELNRTELRNELKMHEFEINKKSELEKMKSRFFANLSHEFRTPLMLIKGPLEQLKEEKNDGKFLERIDLIERNSKRLKELIDQLLELAHLEKAEIPLMAKQENLIVILKEIVSSFESLAKQKNIDLKFESDSEPKICWIDRDKLEKIINNLLSNAIKFTPDGGKIIVGLSQKAHDKKQYVEIKVSDNGISIPEDKLPKIFDRFFQVDDSSQRSYGGSGIGLALVKELVDLHKWNISVESEKGKGTEFKLNIPMWDYLEDKSKVNCELENIYSDNDKININVENPVLFKTHKQQNKSDSSKSSILIVDDSVDVIQYLSRLLENEYLILQAENGEEGIKVATDNLPDLIISDVMMPSMDGMELCRIIKSNWLTSDIPVILLTAKATFDSKLDGLEIGADDYITKPFETKELLVRIKNLLEQRKRLRDKYSQNLNLSISTNKLSSADDDFINKALELIDKNIDKANFGTEQLAKELFMSRAQLHRKILAITDQAPGEFVRTIKLKRAAKLLIEKRLSVTQIAYEIGFSSPAQFTRAFTKQFDCLPSEFPTKNKSKKTS